MSLLWWPTAVRIRLLIRDAKLILRLLAKLILRLLLNYAGVSLLRHAARCVARYSAWTAIKVKPLKLLLNLRIRRNRAVRLGNPPSSVCRIARVSRIARRRWQRCWVGECGTPPVHGIIIWPRH